MTTEDLKQNALLDEAIASAEIAGANTDPIEREVEAFQDAIKVDFSIGQEEKLRASLTRIQQETERRVVTEDTSDGYHTFKELYEFRLLYNATLFNEWAAQGKYNVHKSWMHSDGEKCFGGGWFIVVATLPTGDISNHYEEKDWALFDVPIVERAKKWDGHTAQDVATRLRALLIRNCLTN